ncbi:hypothetical protein HPP92_000050 [Vanilla planifolia]|uniref:Uncharacterized protein n=1 Tax=Vanilla planifolia TaxID=51239 RepID=A0A835RZV7_VANPL|nr:hypothetical protein HPP92_000050 [Vanilla planifolia]
MPATCGWPWRFRFGEQNVLVYQYCSMSIRGAKDIHSWRNNVRLYDVSILNIATTGAGFYRIEFHER